MSDNVESKNQLEQTARWTAAVRAYENTREDRLFTDPWAESLAGQEGKAWMAGKTPDSVAPIILRTRYFDDFLVRIANECGLRQIVLMAAGLDTRAFRLDWPEQTMLFELDRSEVLAEKAAILRSAGALPTCQRRVAAVDLTEPWQGPLVDAGFVPEQPTMWLLEGFLFYIPSESVERIIDEVNRLAAPGSWLGFDIINSTMLTHPLTHAWIDMQAKAGAPWMGTMDDPVAFLQERGWQVTLTQAGQPDANYGRWPLPVLPTLMPDVPHNWFVTAEKTAG